jgi:hypothetical protein
MKPDKNNKHYLQYKKSNTEVSSFIWIVAAIITCAVLGAFYAKFQLGIDKETPFQITYRIPLAKCNDPEASGTSYRYRGVGAINEALLAIDSGRCENIKLGSATIAASKKEYNTMQTYGLAGAVVGLFIGILNAMYRRPKSTA